MSSGEVRKRRVAVFTWKFSIRHSAIFGSIRVAATMAPSCTTPLCKGGSYSLISRDGNGVDGKGAKSRGRSSKLPPLYKGGPGGVKKTAQLCCSFSAKRASRPLINLCPPTVTGIRNGKFPWTFGVRNPACCVSTRIAADKFQNGRSSHAEESGGVDFAHSDSNFGELRNC